MVVVLMIGAMVEVITDIDVEIAGVIVDVIDDRVGLKGNNDRGLGSFGIFVAMKFVVLVWIDEIDGATNG